MRSLFSKKGKIKNSNSKKIEMVTAAIDIKYFSRFASFMIRNRSRVQGSKVVFTANLPVKVARLPKFYGGQVRRAGSQSSIQQLASSTKEKVTRLG
jgi:hypothetical protein